MSNMTITATSNLSFLLDSITNVWIAIRSPRERNTYGDLAYARYKIEAEISREIQCCDLNSLINGLSKLREVKDKHGKQCKVFSDWRENIITKINERIKERSESEQKEIKTFLREELALYLP